MSLDGAGAEAARPSDSTNGAARIPVPDTLDGYVSAVDRRRAVLHPSEAVRRTTLGYSIDPVGAAPHGTSINAMTLSRDGDILLSGGSDGYVRWYDLYATMNGKSMLTQNLRNTFVDGVTKGGVLTSWWGNMHMSLDDTVSDRERPLSPVHSLVCQRDGLWGMCGGQDGNVSLWGLRQCAGATRHVFRKHTSAVSALALAPSETELVSGGWDRAVYQWDLNTGQVVRSYDGHAGQISCVAFRPVHPAGSPPLSAMGNASTAASQTTEDTAMEEATASTSPFADDELEVELKRTLSETQDGDEDPSGGDADAEKTFAYDDASAEHDAVLDSDGADGDSLFGGNDESLADAGEADASGESADGEANSTLDADGEEDMFDDADQPPAPANPVGDGDESDDAPLSTLPADGAHAAAPSAAPFPLALPGQKTEEAPTPPAQLTTQPKTLPMREQRAPELPKPMFGSMNSPIQNTSDVSVFSRDVMLTSTLSGQVLLWDRRVDAKGKNGVRALALPPGTPPWCMSVCWNHAGTQIYVGRRNETVDEWDVRMLPDVHGGPPNVAAGKEPRFVRSLRLPRGSGPVTAVTVMPNDRHIVCGSFDNVRLWDTQAPSDAHVPFKIVAGHHGGMISHLLLDKCARFLLSSSGDRGWFSTSTETLLMHEVTPL
ncbi:Transcription factor spt8 [Malassezia sp. CBS 17886]|nr:Transcription factor spt8 [Malassezia sp. CBS 17886]